MTERSAQNRDWVPLFERPITDAGQEVFNVFKATRRRGIHLATSPETLHEEIAAKVDTGEAYTDQLIEDGKNARVKKFIHALVDNRLEKIAAGVGYE